ncbi:MAG: AAA family ATPase [Anaerolineales bacterium]|nr:AAA family ATPase [Anaerolineales bacterium]
MPELEIALLGPFQVRLAGEGVSHFATLKVQALLAYLAVEAAYPHSRETLAALLWPEQPEELARLSLRQTLFKLRQVILPAYVTSSRQTIQFNPHSDYSLDVATFTTLINACHRHPHPNLGNCPSCLAQLQTAVALYRGDFLTDFFLADSAPFEEWALLKREWLRREALHALYHLAAYHQQQGDYEVAYPYAWRQVELDPLREEAYQQLLLILALSGRRSEALEQYQVYRRVLAEELAAEPAAETTALYQRIRSGELGRSSQECHSQIGFGPTSPPLPPTPAGPCVAREQELAHLHRFLELTQAGHGRVVFVSGETGSGKTTLVNEFVQQAQAAHPHLIVAAGSGNAYTGGGDPYLPFREVMRMLTADVEAQGLSAGHARRLWSLLPQMVELLVTCGPDLLDTFISGESLLNRAAAHTPTPAAWRERLQTLLVHKDAANRLAHQSHLFEQYTNVLRGLAGRQPMLLILDDLHWADLSSIGLLFHVGRRIETSPILIIGVYRPEELSRSQTEEPHPLLGMLSEFKHHFGDITVDLDRPEPAAGRTFVDALLDSEPNRLSDNFRGELARQTGGNPLFTVELLRYMQERGDLCQDEMGRWVEGTHLDWASLPARVEGVLEKRIGRLEIGLREALQVASVEGETFTAEVVARVRAIDERKLVGHLSGELDKQQRLIRSQSSQRLAAGEQQLSRYRFRHILFQAYLYHHLRITSERIYLHEAVAHTLEQLYGAHTEIIAIELARHFRLAGLVQKAVDYLQQAGEKAMAGYAHHEAVLLFDEALTLLKTLPETPEHIQQELSLQITLGNVLLAIKGFAAVEVEQAFGRARELCGRAGETPQLLQVMHGLFRYYLVRGAIETTRELGQQIMEITQRQSDTTLLLPAELCLGITAFFKGEFSCAQEHFSRGAAYYDPQQQQAQARRFGQDAISTCLTQSALALWHLGYPDQALQESREAVALAQKSEHPFSLALTLSYAGWLYQLCREPRLTQTQADSTITFSGKHGFVFWLAMGVVHDGWRLSAQGEIEQGITRICQGLATWQSTGADLMLPYYLALLAEAYGRSGQVEKALSTLAEALVALDRSRRAKLRSRDLSPQGGAFGPTRPD